MLAGILLGLSASASWALANVVVQRAGRSVGALPALFWALLVGIALSAAGSAALDSHGAPFTAATAVWLVVAGASGLLAYICLFYAFEHGRLTLAVPIMSSWAVLSAGLSIVLFGERLSPGQLVGAASVVAGAVVVARQSQSAPAGGASTAVRRGWLPASFGAALGFGVLMPAMRVLSPVFGAVGTAGAVYAAALALAVPLAAAFRVRLPFPPRAAWPAILLSGLFETLGSVCITIGARHAPLAIVSPLASLAAAFTVAFAWAVLHERPARGVLIGALLVSAGVVVLAL
ncbi:MAG TPA: DMT family transporter [Polyangia bacterium]|nr:DMT family transporter [Polyangia bacterium]HVY37438.1 DMT family transporter [Polyangia bacterium]